MQAGVILSCKDFFGNKKVQRFGQTNSALFTEDVKSVMLEFISKQ